MKKEDGRAVRILTVRMDDDTLEKFRVVAASHGRAMIREAEALIKDAIRAYEKKNGPIDLSLKE